MSDNTHKTIEEMHGHQATTNYVDDEINLRELVDSLWQGKWIIIVITAFFAVASVFYALSLPNEYRAEAVLAPASSQGGSQLSQLASQYGGLASLAGVSLGKAETNDIDVALEMMQSWEFLDEFIKRHNLQVPLFAATGWNFSENEYEIDSELYSVTEKKWVREATQTKTSEPTSWELYKIFNKSLAVSQNKESGLIKVAFVHYSPQLAQRITRLLIDDVNAHMKKQAFEETDKNISYLEAQASQTPISEMRNVFYSLIEEQMKSKMLADVNEQYALKTVSKAMQPEEKFAPSRATIILGLTLLGAFLSIFLVLFKRALKD